MEAQTPSPPSLKAKVFIVEDHPLIREGLTLLIGNESDMTVCGSAGSPQEALEAIKQSNPDAVKEYNYLNAFKAFQSLLSGSGLS